MLAAFAAACDPRQGRQGEGACAFNVGQCNRRADDRAKDQQDGHEHSGSLTEQPLGKAGKLRRILLGKSGRIRGRLRPSCMRLLPHQRNLLERCGRWANVAFTAAQVGD